MSLGEAAATIDLALPIGEAFTLAHQAAEKTGKVVRANPDTGRIILKSRYGLQSVKVQIEVAGEGSASTICLYGFSDDVWAGGAKKVMDRYVGNVSALIALR